MSKPENLKLDERISYLETFKTKVLWENQTPSANMAGDVEINFTSDDYDEIRWFYIFSNSEGNLSNNQSISCKKGCSVTLFAIGYASNSTVRRIIDYVSDTQYKTRVAKRDNEDNNSYCIPVMAIGIKYYKGDEGESVDVLEQTLDEYLQVFNTSIQTKKQELESIINEAKSEINNTTNKYARALPGTVQDASFVQIYTDSPVIEELEIKGLELTQKTRDDKNKFITIFSQNGATRIKSGKIKVEANTQYTFKVKSTLNHSLQFAVNYYKTDGTYLSSSPYYGNGGNFTTPADTNTLEIQVRDFENSGVNNNINVSEVIEPQLELGSSATAYQEPGASPSIEHPSEIENVANSIKVDITGKNFIGYKENGTATSQGITVDYNNGIFTVNGTVTQERDLYFNLVDILSINSYANQSKQPKRKLYKNKYMLSYKFISGTKSRADMNMVIANKVTNADIRFPFNNCHYTNKNMIVDITENLDYYIYFWLPKNMTFSNFEFTLQLEVGENITELEPYRNKTFNITLPENSFFGEFKGYKNYIKNNKLHNNLKLLILTGQENWAFSSPGYNLAKAGISNINAPYNSTNIMCNYFKVNTGTTAVGEMRVGTNYLVFNYDDGVGGVDAWKSFLQEKYNAGTPVVVLYLTNTEEEEELPTATQTLLNSIELYEDINNIGIDGGTISFKYNKSLARVIEELYRLASANNASTAQESEVLCNADN